MEVFLALLGIPNDLGDQGLLWVRSIINWLASPMSEELAGPGQQAFAELSDYTRSFVESERDDPGDNMLGEVIRAHLSEGSYSSEAVTVAVVSLLLGGLETMCGRRFSISIGAAERTWVSVRDRTFARVRRSRKSRCGRH